MVKQERVALYLRVSRDVQTTDNQRLDPFRNGRPRCSPAEFSASAMGYSAAIGSNVVTAP